MSELSHELEDLGNPDITAALEDVPVRAFIVDRDGIVRWQNAASRAGVGDRKGWNFADVPTPRWASEVRDFVTHVVCSGEPAEFSFDVVETDGKVATREISAAPLRDGDTVVGLFGIGTATAASRTAAATKDQRLTPRQLEVLQLLAEGKSTAQIAAELYLSKTTVRNHIANLMTTLGVHTRVQALVAASRAGMIQMH